MHMKPRSFLDMQTFHFGFPILGQAIIETQNASQAPDKLVGHCAVNAVFTAVQGLADFKRPEGGIAPLCNISWIVGETGERKSSVDADFFRAVHEFRELNAEDADGSIGYKVRKKVWKIKERLLDERLKKALGSNSPWSHITTEAVSEHAAIEPKKPKAVTFLYADTSPVTLKLGLADFPTACVHSTDAMSILQGALFREKTLLCELYSNDTHYFDRYGKRVTLRNKRLCVSAHSQPKRTLSFLRDEGEDFRDSGLAARMTVCYIDKSTQGYRTYDAVVMPTSCRDRFNDRVRHLLEATKRAARRPKFKRRHLTLSPEASRAYLEFANSIEEQMRPGGMYQDLGDYANRLADKVGRLAAALHLFEGYRGEISLSTFQAARSFYDEATKDFRFLFNYLPSDQCLADMLLQWIRNYCAAKRTTKLKKAQLYSDTYLRLRKKAALDPALSLLEYQGHLYLEKDGSGTHWVCLGRRQDLGWNGIPSGWSQTKNDPFYAKPC